MTSSEDGFEFRGVNHLALVCSDMERTVDFYTNVLGMALIKTIELPAGMGQHFFFDCGGDDLLAFFSAQPGFIDGYRLASNDQVGRVTIWESEAAAEQAANSQHTLAVRSQLLRLAEANATELALEGVRAGGR